MGDRLLGVAGRVTIAGQSIVGFAAVRPLLR
jgi:hypothetical protein